MNRINNPDNSLPYHLRGAFRGYETALGRYLKRFGLPVSQFYILRLQWDTSGNNQTDLAKRAFMSESVASQVIKKMEVNGLVRRKPDPEDSRKHLVSLTYTGEKLRTKIANNAVTISDEFDCHYKNKIIMNSLESLVRVTE